MPLTSAARAALLPPLHYDCHGHRQQPPCSCRAAFSAAAKQLPCSRLAPATTDTAPSASLQQLHNSELHDCRPAANSVRRQLHAAPPTWDCRHLTSTPAANKGSRTAQLCLPAPCAWRRVAPTPAVPWQPAPRHRLRASCHQLHYSHYYLVTAVNREPHRATYVTALHAPFS
jgi:hypothetical protein